MVTKKTKETTEAKATGKGSKRAQVVTDKPPVDPDAVKATPKEPIVISVDDSSEESRLFGIVERLFDDMSKNPQFNIAQVGGLSISLPEGGALKLTKDNVEKITVLLLLFKKLNENEPEALQKKYRQEFGPKIGKLVKSAGDAPIDVRELIKDLFQRLPEEKRAQRPPADQSGPKM